LELLVYVRVVAMADVRTDGYPGGLNLATLSTDLLGCTMN